MGKNGSGKSTLAKVLVGHPDYGVTGGSAVFKGGELAGHGTRGKVTCRNFFLKIKIKNLIR
jgi:Fe-S cluster assembly ATPase SufC